MNNYDELQQQITYLASQIDCIKNGDCFAGVGGGENIYTNDGTLGSGRIAAITDTFEFKELAKGVVIHTFSESGHIWFNQANTNAGVGIGVQKVDPILAKLHIKGNSEDESGKLLYLTDSGAAARTQIYNNGRTIFEAYGSAAIAAHSFSAIGENAFGLKVLNASTGAFGNSHSIFASGSSTIATFVSSIHGEIDTTPVDVSAGVSGGSTTGAGHGYHFTDNSISYIAGLSGGIHLGTNTPDLVIGSVNSAGYSNATDADRTYIGTYGEAFTSFQGAPILMGGQFRAFAVSTLNANARYMAINVPSTNNYGNVVLGADLPSVKKSMLELTGAFEIVNTDSKIFMKDSAGVRWEFKIAPGTGNVTTTLAP